ncbi:hypothetical protein LCGC14_2638190 [marine sediment metagenome]|uniref:Uncharacterized protein n=1 Tax=marine sediment metagenome TaxID=412755 RepID=A0A0F9AKU4_9ZZZZ
MYRYRFTGGKGGIMTVFVDDKSYEVANNHRTLPEVIELPRKVNIVGLELEQNLRKGIEKVKIKNEI